MQACPNCNYPNRTTSKFCVKCGSPVKRKNKLVLPILIAAGLIVVMLIMMELGIVFNPLAYLPTPDQSFSQPTLESQCVLGAPNSQAACCALYGPGLGSGPDCYSVRP